MLRPAAALYDRVMRGVEEAGLAVWRDELLAPLSGSVLEVGAGTGVNVARYPTTVEHLVLTEPNRHMRARLAPLARGRGATVLDAPAEELPLESESFDAVVATLVLCSVRDPDRALTEIHRVLRPGGRFVFIEHVAASDRPRRLAWQHRIEPAWKLVAGNCHLTRSTEETIRAAGLEIDIVERQSMRKAPPIVRPTIRGVALRPVPA